MSKYLKIENKDLNLSFDFYDEVNSGKYVSIDKFMSIATFDKLRDINFSGLEENHFLVYDRQNLEWVNKSPANTFSAIFSDDNDPNKNDLSLLKGLYDGQASTSTTEFLRHDGVWAEPEGSSIVGIAGDETTKELTLAEDFKLVFSSSTSTKLAKLTTEVATSDRQFTFPDEINGEVSLSPMYNTYYLKDFDGSTPVTFTKNNESVWLVGGTIHSDQDAENDNLDIFLELPDPTTLTNFKSIGQTSLGSFSTRRGVRFKICRHKSANIYIAPQHKDHLLEILGNSITESDSSRQVPPQNLEVGKVYRIVRVVGGFNAQAYGAPNNDEGTFFKCTQQPGNNFTGTVPLLFECVHVTPQDLKFGFIDIVGYQMGNSSANFCYTISTPAQVFESPTFSGDVSFTGKPVFGDDALFNKNIIAQDGINLREPSANGTNYVKLTAPAIGSSDSYTLTLPNTSSTADNQIMKADENGNFQWVTIQNDTSLGADSSTSNVDVPTQDSIKSYISDYVESSFREYLDENVNDNVYEIKDYESGQRPEVFLGLDVFGKETGVTLELNSNPDYWMPVIYLPPVGAGLSPVTLGQQFDIIVENRSQFATPMAHTDQRNFYKQYIAIASHPNDPKIFNFYSHFYMNAPPTRSNFQTMQILDDTEGKGSTNYDYFNFSALTKPETVMGPGTSNYAQCNLSRQQGGFHVDKLLKISDFQADGWLPSNLANATLTGTPLWDPAYAIKIANSPNVRSSRKNGGAPDGVSNNGGKWNITTGLPRIGNAFFTICEAATVTRFRITVNKYTSNTHRPPSDTSNRGVGDGFTNLTPGNTNNVRTTDDKLFPNASTTNRYVPYQWRVQRIG